MEIFRLRKKDLRSSAYKALIDSLFVRGRLADRLAYAKWAFGENPALGTNEDLPIYLCKIKGETAGQLGIIPVEVLLKGKLIRAGWCVDFHVKPDFQLLGIGKKLLFAAYENFPLLMTLGQTDAPFNLFNEKLQWRYNGNRLICYKSFTRSRTILKLIRKKAGVLKEKTEDTLPINESQNSNIHSLDSLNEIAGLDWLHTANKNKEAYIVKGEKFMEWRYMNHPFINYNFTAINGTEHDRIYFVWRMVHNGFFQYASIVDVFYENGIPETALRNACNLMRKFAAFNGAEIIECKTNDHFLLSALSQGLFTSRADARFLYGMPDMSKCPVVQNDQWKLYAGDCDVESLSF